MHISGQRAPTTSKGNDPRNVMQIPSISRPLSKNGLPWGGILGFCIAVSFSVNIFSLTLNKYQVSLLSQLTALNSTAREGLTSNADDSASLLLGVSGPDSRRLSSASGSAAAASQHPYMPEHCFRNHTGGHEGPHDHDALLYLFNTLVVGAVVMQISARYPILQQTIVLFVIGFFVSLLLKGLNLKDKIAVWGDSYEMWMQIDPHLLLFTLLPALLAGDAMTIDTSVAKRVGLQCLYLAGPGVVIGGFSTACFLFYYIEWESEEKFLLSLCAGSILCATDPVAVVALLKELGASPVLTVQIQGESLLNDGTAIVLYLISYNMLSGIEYDFIAICSFLVEKAVMAFAMGLFIGYFFFAWIRLASNRFDHGSSMIQIVLTLCCAYWSFLFVEGILGQSGVLATVASSLVLAHHMWPYIVSAESMNHVWHTFEALGNIIVFFLAGSITGFIVTEIDYIDYLHLIVIYLVLLIIRAALLFSSRPLLQYLSQDRMPVSWQDTTLMVWGGLRGAVGLCLAIQVNKGRAPNKDGVQQISPKDAERLCFFVSGIAFLTTLVNAASSPYLVHKLEITALPYARKTLVKMFHHQLVLWSKSNEDPPAVTVSLQAMLGKAAAEIDNFQSKTSVSSDMGAQPTEYCLTRDISNIQVKRLRSIEKMSKRMCKYQSNKDLIREARTLRQTFSNMLDRELKLIGGPLPENLFGKGEEMCLLIGEEHLDICMVRVVNQTFLTMVYNNYWQQISEGLLRPGGPESSLLLTSVRFSLDPVNIDLVDFKFIVDKLIGPDGVGACLQRSASMQGHRSSRSTRRSRNSVSSSQEVQEADYVTAELSVVSDVFPTEDSGRLGRVVASMPFGLFIAAVILLNSIVVGIEELVRSPANDSNPGWMIIDCIFTSIFVVEFFMKLISMRCDYFMDGWNRFDFFLVVAGVVGLVMNLTHSMGGEGNKLAGETRIIRLGRVLRTMRFLRIFRLFNARLHRDRFVSVELARHMTMITTMKCFILCHIKAQNMLLQYFGGNGEFDEVHEVEIARCILQSQVATYKALKVSAEIQQRLSPTVLKELENLYKRKYITEGLTTFITQALTDGAISQKEAHAMLSPLNSQVSHCIQVLNTTSEGLLNADGHVRSGASSDHLHQIKGGVSSENLGG